jgi:glycosyltransferase involved in cell wall biosynthesis
MKRIVERRISVIVPVFQMGHFLPEAIASIDAQSYDDIEIVIVDDGSTDQTPDAVASLGDRVVALRQSNRGPAAARNAGLAVATGDLIGFLDADDLWPEGKLARQLERLERDPELDVVLGRIQYLALDGGVVPDIEFEDLDLKTLSHVHLGSGLYRRRAFELLGAFDEGLRYSEDVDWFMRAREAQLRVAILPDVTLVYRRHATNMTLEMSVRTSGMLTVLKRSLDRRRAVGISGDLPTWRTFDERRPDTPTVSVVIPAFNAAKHLREAIRSVLDQTHRPLEVIVVDDGSCDATASVASRFGSPVRVVRRPHRGAGAARNAGLHQARGEFIGLLDADDMWEPSKLVQQLALFESDPELDLVFAGVEQFVSPEAKQAVFPKRHGQSRTGRIPSALLMRADVVHRVGPYREDVKLAEFIDWYDRALATGCRVDQVDTPLVRRRIHRSNTGSRQDRGDWATVMKAVLDRRRATDDGRR